MFFLGGRDDFEENDNNNDRDYDKINRIVIKLKWRAIFIKFLIKRELKIDTNEIKYICLKNILWSDHNFINIPPMEAKGIAWKYAFNILALPFVALLITEYLKI